MYSNLFYLKYSNCGRTVLSTSKAVRNKGLRYHMDIENTVVSEIKFPSLHSDGHYPKMKLICYRHRDEGILSKIIRFVAIKNFQKI